MRVRTAVTVMAALGATAGFVPVASAREKVLTLYSPQLTSRPYVHISHQVALRPNGREAPKEAGYITGFKEQVLVDSKKPDAKPLPVGKMMVHHFLYFAPGRVDQAPGSCWGQTGFIAGRGEEHPSGRFDGWVTKAARKKYGIANRNEDGEAPGWRLTAMVMNHYKKVKKFYVRTKIYYTTEKRIPVTPIVVGDCSKLVNGMAYDVPGGGRPGSNYVNQSRWTVPAGFNGRILGASSHQHGGGKYQTLTNVTCRRKIFKAPVYYGMPDHIYNTIRPILHEPGPIANGTYRSQTGIPIHEGEVLERKAVHDNANLHVAAMGFWALLVIRDDSVGKCEAMPTDVRQIARPERFDRTPNYGLVVPQLAKPQGPWSTFSGSALDVGDQFFAPPKVRVRRGTTVTWRFTGSEPHSVSVANGPRGFSSIYWGQTGGTYSFKPTVRGTYRLTCLVHPTTMAETLVVK